MKNNFRDAEDSFEKLKKEFRQGEISRTEFINRLKELRLKDDEGKFWMIGAQTGKWYYYDGKNWIRADPPSLMERKAICIYCGYENSLEDNVCASCGESLSKEEKKDTTGSISDRMSFSERNNDEYFIFRSVNPVSFLLFNGIVGLIVGLIFGAFTGVAEYFPSIIKMMPLFLQELHGKLFGSIFYSLLGGVAGFILFGIVGFLAAIIINTVSSMVGGIKIRITH